MFKHSEKLEDTRLWKEYKRKIKKCPHERERINWLLDAFETTAVFLSDVTSEFKNYTLHNRVHILNVIDSMGGLLGKSVSELSTGEIELLILVAIFHDVGMVYSTKHANATYANSRLAKKFIIDNYPNECDCVMAKCSTEIQQDFLRSRHPFRVAEVIRDNRELSDLFERRKEIKELPDKETIVEVCAAHGETLSFSKLQKLQHSDARDIDLLFCAMLLRLSDLLDFDYTRAPRVLLDNAKDNAKSLLEWKKHISSAGFNYDKCPSAEDLPYLAECDDPQIEHAIKCFLDWIDLELSSCIGLQHMCIKGWQQTLLFPRKVSRKEIKTPDFENGDFCITMDQARILELLSGANLYHGKDVFVRELLQNAVDATLLRHELDEHFELNESARIDIWEWDDKDGHWFRIDDNGTGMTLNMIKNYLLKVGNSYYNSDELTRDRKRHGKDGKNEFHRISQFGIGFLSCFLCGEEIEVSTLSFDRAKCMSEDLDFVAGQEEKEYGVRLLIPSMGGYYTLKKQDKHSCNTLRKHPLAEDESPYRTNPGTSILIRINTLKLQKTSLKRTVEETICGTRFPVYYNNIRVGKMRNEFVDTIRELSKSASYSLSDEEKQLLAHEFPEIGNNYPKITPKIILLDGSVDKTIGNCTVGVIKYEIEFDNSPTWMVKDQLYKLHVNLSRYQDKDVMTIYPKLATEKWVEEWAHFENEYGRDKVETLEKQFKEYDACPRKEDIDSNVWATFEGRESINGLWNSYVYHNLVYKRVCLCVKNNAFIDTKRKVLLDGNNYIKCFYNGVSCGDIGVTNNFDAVVLLDDEWKPIPNLSRDTIKKLPLEILILLSDLLKSMDDKDYFHFSCSDSNYRLIKLKKWREILSSGFGKQIIDNQKSLFDLLLNEYEKSNSAYLREFHSYGCLAILRTFFVAFCQFNYSMEIELGQYQRVFFKDLSEYNNNFDLFPPLMFCKSANSESKGKLCGVDRWSRLGINLDHGFAKWLVENAIVLKRSFESNFEEIVDALADSYDVNIIGIVNSFHDLLETMPLSIKEELHFEEFPKLSNEDFWYPPEVTISRQVNLS